MTSAATRRARYSGGGRRAGGRSAEGASSMVSSPFAANHERSSGKVVSMRQRRPGRRVRGARGRRARASHSPSATSSPRCDHHAGDRRRVEPGHDAEHRDGDEEQDLEEEPRDRDPASTRRVDRANPRRAFATRRRGALVPAGAVGSRRKGARASPRGARARRPSGFRRALRARARRRPARRPARSARCETCVVSDGSAMPTGSALVGGLHLVERRATLLVHVRAPVGDGRGRRLLDVVDRASSSRDSASLRRSSSAGSVGAARRGTRSPVLPRGASASAGTRGCRARRRRA